MRGYRCPDGRVRDSGGMPKVSIYLPEVRYRPYEIESAWSMGLYVALADELDSPGQWAHLAGCRRARSALETASRYAIRATVLPCVSE